MNFANPELLWLLLIVPIFGALEYWQNSRRLKMYQAFSERSFLKHWVPRQSIWWKHLKVFLLLLSMVLVILALARPQGKPIQKEVLEKKTAIYFVLDCSTSMRARDISPNRLQAAKKTIARVVAGLPSKKVGLIIFNQQAMVMCPITYDRQSFLIALKQIRINALPEPGSNPAAGMKLAIGKLKELKGVSRAIVLLSDGEENSQKPLDIYGSFAKEHGIKIVCIGFGTLKGARIPQGKDFWGKSQFKKYQGKIVKTRLQALDMRKIAKTSGGFYCRWTNEDSEIKKVILALRKIVSIEKSEEKIWVYVEYFPWLIIVVFLLLLIEPFISFVGRRYYE